MNAKIVNLAIILCHNSFFNKELSFIIDLGFIHENIVEFYQPESFQPIK